MRYIITLTGLLVLSISPPDGYALPPLPVEFGQGPVMIMSASPRSWVPDNMYEHVNGEAELLKRYGARELIYAIYKQSVDRYLSVDLLDMGSAINAYGLYRLYAGCESDQFKVSGATVLGSGWTYYAQREQYFFRIDVDTADTKRTVSDFLEAFFKARPAPGAPSEILGHLQEAAGKTCEVNYHPEDVDYDLNAGPGYTWTGPDGRIYHLRLLETEEATSAAAAELINRGANGVKVRGNIVAWPKETSGVDDNYLEKVLEIVDR